MAKYELTQQILAHLQQQLATGMASCGPEAITANVEASRPTVNRYLARMAAAGAVRKVGSGPATDARSADPSLPQRLPRKRGEPCRWRELACA